MGEIHDHLKAEMRRTQEIQRNSADAHRQTAPIFRPGDRVWLDAQNIKTRRPSAKLDHRRIGPYEVENMVGSHAVRLRLPDTVRIHPVFHVSLLELAADDPFPWQTQPPPPPIEVDGEEEWEVERIVNSRFRYRRLQYLVRWVGYDSPTWQPSEDLEHLQDAVLEYHRLWPDQPRPNTLARART